MTHVVTYHDIFCYLTLSVGHMFGYGSAGSLKDEIKASAGPCSFQETQVGKDALISFLRYLGKIYFLVTSCMVADFFKASVLECEGCHNKTPHRSDGLNNEPVFSHSLGSRKSEVKLSIGWFLLGFGLQMAILTPSFLCASLVSLCMCSFPLIKSPISLD